MSMTDEPLLRIVGMKDVQNMRRCATQTQSTNIKSVNGVRNMRGEHSIRSRNVRSVVSVTYARCISVATLGGE